MNKSDDWAPKEYYDALDKLGEQMTVKTKQERIELIEEAKILGMKSVTIDGVTYEFKEQVKVIDSTPMTDAEIKKMLSPEFSEEYSDEEVLFWSTPHFDDIQAEKQLREEHAKQQIKE